jgi:AraC-like DNA-binding protein
VSEADALLHAVKRHALGRLDDPELQPGTLAAAHGLDVRSLTRLFRGTGTTASSWLRRSRLERCAADLRDDHDATVGEIARQWCFDDAMHLSLAFRAEFGATPTEYRRGFLS